jgi:hypothetical protein
MSEVEKQIEELQRNMDEILSLLEQHQGEKGNIKYQLCRFIPASRRTIKDIADQLLGMSYGLLSIQKQILRMQIISSIPEEKKSDNMFG